MSTSTTADERRFAALWDEHSPRVQAYALRHADREAAQEVVADTFLVAWRRLADVPADALPWLLVVARNTLRNHHRATARARRLHDVLASLAPPPPDDPAAAVAEREALLRGLAALGDADREAVLLVAWDGLTPAQAADVLGCSPAAFKMRLSRARRRLTRAADGTPTAPLALVPGNLT